MDLGLNQPRAQDGLLPTAASAASAVDSRDPFGYLADRRVRDFDEFMAGRSDDVLDALLPSAGGEGKKRMKFTKIDHNYRDFYNNSLEEVSYHLSGGGGVGDGTSVSLPPPPEAKGGGSRSSKPVSFPQKLYEMVTNPDYQHIICFVSRC